MVRNALEKATPESAIIRILYTAVSYSSHKSFALTKAVTMRYIVTNRLLHIALVLVITIAIGFMHFNRESPSVLIDKP